MESKSFVILFVLVILQTTKVSAVTRNSDIIGMAVAGCAGFALLSVVVGIVVVSFMWTPWFNRWMRLRGKSKVPKVYFRKKQDTRRALLLESLPPPGPHGAEKTSAPKANSTGSKNNTLNTAPKKNGPIPYEEKGVALELDDEAIPYNDEYTIETEVLEDEDPNNVLSSYENIPDLPSKVNGHVEPVWLNYVSSEKANPAAQAELTITPIVLVPAESVNGRTEEKRQSKYEVPKGAESKSAPDSDAFIHL